MRKPLKLALGFASATLLALAVAVPASATPRRPSGEGSADGPCNEAGVNALFYNTEGLPYFSVGMGNFLARHLAGEHSGHIGDVRPH